MELKETRQAFYESALVHCVYRNIMTLWSNSHKELAKASDEEWKEGKIINQIWACVAPLQEITDNMRRLLSVKEAGKMKFDRLGYATKSFKKDEDSRFTLLTVGLTVTVYDYFTAEDITTTKEVIIPLMPNAEDVSVHDFMDKFFDANELTRTTCLFNHSRWHTISKELSLIAEYKR